MNPTTWPADTGRPVPPDLDAPYPIRPSRCHVCGSEPPVRYYLVPSEAPHASGEPRLYVLCACRDCLTVARVWRRP